ncbi:P1 family peptidase [Streptoalloteichus tenebrarius]|uniref:P1 family peptidase n=1 Tax=Streptoalloteichus tenebrarius (strain ATCC 17920 / DSM 40477 / JCM 4838 / CBS 697.72 / NBRC 16177 / NCIMB 11028 / NRRL B-12390 / A12253. 1 / ISP 5477) TaxID=1933 RepID=UPI00355699C5
MSGPHNAITDVPGVLVGHHHRLGAGWATGATVVLTPEGAVGGVDVRGGGPGTRETELLDPSRLVDRVHGVCLAGGSAYGLAAADGVMRWLAERGHGFPVGAEPHQVVPIVPAAVLFDLPLGDWGNRPDAEFGYAACAAATDGPVAQGCVGAGTGATAGSLKGGVGTASAVLPDGSVVGAVLAVNAFGEVVDPDRGTPWAWELGLPGEFGLRAPAAEDLARAKERLVSVRQPMNTVIGVVATDAALSKAECRRVATVAQDGLARAIRPAHSLFDGDTLFAVSTGRRELGHDADAYASAASRAGALDAVCAAAADVVSRAVVHGLLAATTVGAAPAYRDVFPSAFSGGR